MRSKRAIDIEMEAARAKKQEQESLIEELVSNWLTTLRLSWCASTNAVVMVLFQVHVYLPSLSTSSSYCAW